jgi:peptidoglycan/xylan/chitin deacetylase (PgdA/CDA1 family)
MKKGGLSLLRIRLKQSQQADRLKKDANMAEKHSSGAHYSSTANSKFKVLKKRATNKKKAQLAQAQSRLLYQGQPHPRGSNISVSSHYSKLISVAPDEDITYLTPDDSQPASASSRHRKGPSGPKVLALLIAATIIGVIAYLIFNPLSFQVTVNGSAYTVNAGTTLQDLIDDGYASPKAGNLIAVDGSVATEGGGQAFSATINGGNATSDAKTVVHKGDTIDFSDGGDVNESYSETTEEIPYSTVDAPTTATAYYNGSIHLFVDGQNGEQVTRTGDVSGISVTEATQQPVAAGYHTYTADVGSDKVVALTFDDGPWPTTTAEILQILKDNDIHATFFEIGNQIADNADVVKALHDDGNQIGSHTWDHAAGAGQGVNLTYMTADEQIEEVQKGFDAIDSVVGTQVSRVLRAPGGNYYGSLVETLHPYVGAEIGWNIDTRDWSRPGTDKIVAAIEKAQPGDVILCHDGGGDRSQTVEALKIAIPYLKQEGYSFVTIDQLLAYGIPNDESSSS